VWVKRAVWDVLVALAVLLAAFLGALEDALHRPLAEDIGAAECAGGVGEAAPAVVEVVGCARHSRRGQGEDRGEHGEARRRRRAGEGEAGGEGWRHWAVGAVLAPCAALASRVAGWCLR